MTTSINGHVKTLLLPHIEMVKGNINTAMNAMKTKKRKESIKSSKATKKEPKDPKKEPKKEENDDSYAPSGNSSTFQVYNFYFLI